MITYDQNKQDMLQVFRSAIAFAVERKNKDAEKFLKEAMQHLSDGKLFVVVCGEYKKGKSSFINALLDEIDLCPVDIDVTTSLVSTIGYGDPEKISIFFGEPGQEVSQEKRLKSRNEIPDYVTEQGNPHNIKRARLLAIQLPNKKLESGLMLVDTPGVGGINSEHTDVTTAFLFQADVILYSCDALEPLSAVELRFIEKFTRSCPDVVFIVTKKDQNPQFQVVVEDNRQKIATTLKRAEEDIMIIPVSNLAKRDYLDSHDEEDLKESNFVLLETKLWQDLNEGRARILLLKAATVLGRSIDELRFPIQTELDVCREQDQRRLDEMEREVKEQGLRLQNLLENNAQWQNQLREGLEDIQQKIAGEFSKGFTHIKQFVNTYLDDKRYWDQPEQIVNLLQADMNGLLTDLQKEVEQGVASLQAAIERDAQLSLNPYRGLSLTLTDQPPTPLDREKMGLWQKTLDVVRNSSASGGAGATISGLLGGIVGGAIGLVSGGMLLQGMYYGSMIGGAIGQLAGTVTGVRRTIRQINKQERTEIARYLLSFVQDQEAILASQLRSGINDLERFMRNDFTAQITREKKSVEEALLASQNARKLTHSQSAARITQLSMLLQHINSMQQPLDKILSSLVQPAVRVGVGNSKQEVTPGQQVQFEAWADE